MTNRMIIFFVHLVNIMVTAGIINNLKCSMFNTVQVSLASLSSSLLILAGEVLIA